MTGNLMHLAALLEREEGLPTEGNQREQVTFGDDRIDTNPEYR